MTNELPIFEHLESRRLFTGVFGPAVLVHGPAPLEQIEAAISGDFDGDGIVDLAACAGKSVEFSKGHGDGTFAPSVRTTLSSGVGLMATGRFDGSGREEIATLGSAGRNPLSRPSSPAVWRGYALRVLAFDHNTGGLAVVARQLLIIPHEDLPGVFSFSHLLAADVLGSARDEFIVGLNITVLAYGLYPEFLNTPDRSLIAVFGLNDSGAIVRERTVLDRQGAGNAIALADINGDGRQDLLFRPRYTWRAEISPAAHTGPLSMAPQRITVAGSNERALGGRVKFADVDGDGIADRMVFKVTTTLAQGPFGVSYFRVNISITRGVGDATYGSANALPTITFFQVTPGFKGDGFGTLLLDQIRVRDLNGDRRADILLLANMEYADRGGDHLFLEAMPLLQNSDGTFAPDLRIETYSSSGAFLADVNADGRPDLVTIHARFSQGLDVRLNVTV